MKSSAGHAHVEPSLLGCFCVHRARAAEQARLYGSRWLPLNLFIADIGADGLARARQLLGERKRGIDRYCYSDYDHPIDPSWSPDGGRIAYIGNKDGDTALRVMEVVGRATDTQTLRDAQARYQAIADGRPPIPQESSR